MPLQLFTILVSGEPTYLAMAESADEACRLARHFDSGPFQARPANPSEHVWWDTWAKQYSGPGSEVGAAFVAVDTAEEYWRESGPSRSRESLKD